MNQKDYDKLTRHMVNLIEQTNLEDDWTPPWRSSAVGLPQTSSGAYYRGGNLIMLHIVGQIKGYQSNRWFGFKTAINEGHPVMRGQKGTPIVVFTPRQDEAGNDLPPFVKVDYVWNATQLTDPPKHWLAPDVQLTPVVRDAVIERFIENTKAVINHELNRPAAYNPNTDQIGMPLAEQFDSMEAYYATLFHELVHWTGHQDRLDRKLQTRNKHKYAFEELVAEFGAAFLCAAYGLNSKAQMQDASLYLAKWVSMLREQSTALWDASKLASRAVTFLGANPHIADDQQTSAYERVHHQ